MEEARPCLPNLHTEAWPGLSLPTGQGLWGGMPRTAVGVKSQCWLITGEPASRHSPRHHGPEGAPAHEAESTGSGANARVSLPGFLCKEGPAKSHASRQHPWGRGRGASSSPHPGPQDLDSSRVGASRLPLEVEPAWALGSETIWGVNPGRQERGTRQERSGTGERG